MIDGFNGFSPLALDFLARLSANNNKSWFEAHRKEFEELLMTPLKQLVGDLSEAMLSIDAELVTQPAVDRTISRIYRDTRFSRDKSPYKTTLWITFKRRRPDWKETPCFFFELGADSYRYGMGFYCASRPTMDRLRVEIEYAPNRFRTVLESLASRPEFAVAGERYKRPVDPTLPAELQAWHQQKNVYLVCNRQADPRLFTRAILEDLKEGFSALATVYRFLWQVCE